MRFFEIGNKAMFCSRSFCLFCLLCFFGLFGLSGLFGLPGWFRLSVCPAFGPHHGSPFWFPPRFATSGPHHGQPFRFPPRFATGLTLNPKSLCVGWLWVVGEIAEASAPLNGNPTTILILMGGGISLCKARRQRGNPEP